MRNVVPVLTVLTAILLFWYAAAVWMNTPWQNTLNTRAGLERTATDYTRATEAAY